MLSINNKFEIGEECYTTSRKPIHYKCPICEGNGRFKHNGYDILCKNCNGSGKLHNPKQFVMEVCKVRVRRVMASIGSNESVINYKIDFIDTSDIYVKSKNVVKIICLKHKKRHRSIVMHRMHKQRRIHLMATNR